MEEYLGFKEVTLSDEELALIYQKTPGYNLGCLKNEYLVVHNKSGEVADHFCWNGTHFVQVPYKQINSRFGGKVKPRCTIPKSPSICLVASSAPARPSSWRQLPWTCWREASLKSLFMYETISRLRTPSPSVICPVHPMRS